MDNRNETLGLSIISTTPEAHQTSVNVNSSIKIKFSGHLNRSTLKNSIIVFEDYDNVYNGASSLNSSDKFNIVKGSLSYNDQVVTFKPNSPFNIDTKYIIVLNNTITDITGNKLIKKFVFAFNTEITSSYPACDIVYPTFGLIVNDVPSIQWISQNAPSYILQVSKTNTFEVLLYETFVVEDYTESEKDENSTNTIEHIPDIKYKEGIYYTRVKSEGGEWSEHTQFFIKEITDAVVAEEDESDEFYLNDFLDELNDDIEILEVFPKDNSLSNSLKTNIIYVKLRGIIELNRFNFDEFEIIGKPFDEEDDHDFEHGSVDGFWTVLHDKHEDCTYVVFTFKEEPVLEDSDEEESDNDGEEKEDEDEI